MDLLFLAHRAPFPPDRGDKIRSWHVLRYLAARARVHLVAFAEDEAERQPPPALADALASWTLVPRRTGRAGVLARALLGGRSVSLAAFDNVAMRAAVRRVAAAHPIARAYAFSGQMGQHLPTGVPAVMDLVDVDSAKFATYAGQGTPPWRWLMRREARLLGAEERRLARTAAATLLVSEAEAALFRERGGGGRIEVVENGIDAGSFDPTGVAPLPEAGPLIVFTGQMDYPPNIEAVRWFAAEVLPLLRASAPAARLAIVGRAPAASVRALAGEGVIVTGAVDDVRPWLAAASVCVAPLRLARGVQNKVLEAMAMARPVVASPAAAEGIDHRGTLLVADAPDAWAAAIRDLIGRPAEATALGAAARARVVARYDWAARLAPLDELMALA